MCGVFRNPCVRAGRGPPLVLRPLRAPAPRPGVGRDRGLGPWSPHRHPRSRPRRPGLRRGEAAGAPRRRRDRARALLDDRLVALGERAAARPPRPCAHGRARAQRQPDEHGRAARGALRRRDRTRARPRTRRRSRPGRARPSPLPLATAQAMARLEGAYSVVALAEGSCSVSAIRTGSALCRWGGSATTGCSPPRRARST